VLGIRTDEDIRIEGWLKSWTQKQIEAVVAKCGTDASDRIREQHEWLRRIQELDTWNLLFICGANHFASFANLLQRAGIAVIEACQDWEPILETKTKLE